MGRSPFFRPEIAAVVLKVKTSGEQLINLIRLCKQLDHLKKKKRKGTLISGAKEGRAGEGGDKKGVPLAHRKKAMNNLLPKEGEGQGIVSCALMSLSNPGSLAALSFSGPMMSFEGILSMSLKNQSSGEV